MQAKSCKPIEVPVLSAAAGSLECHAAAAAKTPFYYYLKFVVVNFKGNSVFMSG